MSYCQPPAVVESNNSIVEIIENLSAGAIIGIIVAVLFVICLAIVVCFMVCKEKQGKPVFTNMDKPAKASSGPTGTEMGPA